MGADSKYADKLRGKTKQLGSFVDEALESESDYSFFSIIATRIVPALKSPHFEKIYLHWAHEKNAFVKKQARLKESVKSEVENAFLRLRPRVEAGGFIKDSEVKQSINRIDKILTTKLPGELPPYLDQAVQQINFLLERLLELEAYDIVSDYATIEKAKVPRFNHETDECKYQNKKIKSVSYAPSFFEHSTLEETYYGDLDDPPSWVAWNYLALLNWCWTTPISFFNDIELQAISAESLSEKTYWFEIHGYWCEVNKIKTKGIFAQDYVPFFERARFKTYLKSVVGEVILAQIESENEPLENNEIISPFSVHFRVENDDKLLLDVMWSDPLTLETPITYLILKFQEKSATLEFAKRLEKAENGSKIDISSEYSGGNASKYLARMKINATVKKLLFKKVGEKFVIIKSISIRGNEISQQDRDDLCQWIKQFPELPYI